jgi:hypothetical protein
LRWYSSSQNENFRDGGGGFVGSDRVSGKEHSASTANPEFTWRGGASAPPLTTQHTTHNNITSTYTKQSSNAKSAIDAEAKAIAEQLQIADRAEAFAKRDAYITLKDHKENFVNNPKSD